MAGEPVTSLEWVQASARVHDPEGLWATFAAEVAVAHFFEDGRFGWLEELYVDRGADTFRRQVIGREALLVQTVGPGGECRARWPGAVDASPRELAINGLTGDACAVIRPRRELHEFFLGLPMSALTPDTRFGESPEPAEVFGRSTTRVTLRFADDPGGQTWFLYVDDETHELVAAAFQFTSGQGELLDLRELTTYGPFRLVSRRVVYDFTGADFVIDQRVRLSPIGG